MKSLGVVKGTFWHAKAEILSWKIKLDELLRIVDDGLDFLMGLNHANIQSHLVEYFKGLLPPSRPNIEPKSLTTTHNHNNKTYIAPSRDKTYQKKVFSQTNLDSSKKHLDSSQKRSTVNIISFEYSDDRETT